MEVATNYEKLPFWFNRDSSVPVPAFVKYEKMKDAGLVKPFTSLSDFIDFYGYHFRVRSRHAKWDRRIDCHTICKQITFYDLVQLWFDWNGNDWTSSGESLYEDTYYRYQPCHKSDDGRKVQQCWIRKRSHIMNNNVVESVTWKYYRSVKLKHCHKVKQVSDDAVKYAIRDLEDAVPYDEINSPECKNEELLERVSRYFTEMQTFRFFRKCTKTPNQSDVYVDRTLFGIFLTIKTYNKEQFDYAFSTNGQLTSKVMSKRQYDKSENPIIDEFLVPDEVNELMQCEFLLISQ
jgi:hypothetical protein